MKKVSKIIAAALCVALCAITLTGCSTYNKILKAFKDAEYTEIEATSDKDSPVSFGEDVKVTVHALQSKDKLTSVFIFEFASSKELEEELKDNETLKGLVKDSQKSDMVNGNCICIAIGLKMADAYDIFKNA